MIDYDQFHKFGYGVFKTEDLWLPNDLAEFNKLADEARIIPITSETYGYILSVFGFHNDPKWPFKVNSSERKSRLEEIKTLGLRETQRWYESSHDPNNIKERFQNVINKFIRNFYPELKEDGSNIHYQDAVSIYLDGDHSEIHRDGQNPGRLCVVLAYLTPEEEYNGSGDLVVIGDEQRDDNSYDLKVKPVRGNIAMLDFTKHNPFHGVLPVNPKFIRHCYISFVWNKDKMPDKIKLQRYQ
jgi:2OG-Fe(II) oxygenase superfamily